MSGETARVKGIVVSISDPPPTRWQVRVGRRRWQRSDGGWFELDDGGARTWVEVSSLVEIVAAGDVEEEDGALGELAHRAGLGDLDPPDTPASLTRIALAVGAEVAALGETTGPGVLRGSLVTVGPRAADRLDETIARRATTPRRPPGRRRR
jgi:hypothetical protein